MIPVVGPVEPVVPLGPDEPEGEGLGLAIPVAPVGEGLGDVVGPVVPVGDGLGLVVAPVAPVGDALGLVDVEPVAPVAPVVDANANGTFPPSEMISARSTTIDADLSGSNVRARRDRPGKCISPIPSSASVAPPAPQRRYRRSDQPSEVPNPGIPRSAHAEGGIVAPRGT